MDALLKLCRILAVDFLDKVAGINDTMRELRLCRLPDGGAKRDDLFFISHQLALMGYFLVLLYLFELIVEEEGIPTGLSRLALQPYLGKVVLASVQGTDIP